jgi:hypothetical protein
MMLTSLPKSSKRSRRSSDPYSGRGRFKAPDALIASLIDASPPAI